MKFAKWILPSGMPKVGLEPTRLAPQPPQDCVSTSSTTSAYQKTEYYFLAGCVLPPKTD